ncbi:MAG: hypothetical protein IPM95_13480 [Sphingobacteriales bacterium]|jgi:hypothetical protein|nr:hypothetical protein [Sphingobacteriales bacterium]
MNSEEIDGLKLIIELSRKGVIKITSEEIDFLENIVKRGTMPTLDDSNYNKFNEIIDKVYNKMDHEQANRNKQRLSKIDNLHTKKFKQFLINKVLNDLLLLNTDENVINTIKEISEKSDFFSLDLTSAIKLVKQNLNKDITLKKEELKLLISDCLSQYDGAMNDATRQAFEFNDLLYIGNTCADSRPICTHIKETYNGRLTLNQLESILNEYCPNGIPSEEMITYQTINGIQRTSTKGSGMIIGTTVENFSQFRGGKGCRHTAIWTKHRNS